MRLLGAAYYDPSGAVTKSTASLLAMTALDTTNLRLAVTVPSHGLLRIRIRCVIHGATTAPQIFLGVLQGANLWGRCAPNLHAANMAATSKVVAEADFIVPGLTPGAVNLDAAYAVDVVVASTAIKYGGPDNTTTNDAWGAITFEVWDPQPALPTNFDLLSIDANGRVDVIKIAGEPQTARDIGESVLLSSGTGAGQLNFASGVVRANVMQADGVAWNGGAITKDTFYRDTGLAPAATSTVQNRTASSITLDSLDGSPDDYYNGMLVYITHGSGAGQVRAITDYNGTTKVLSVAPNWTTQPAIGAQYVILPAGPASLSAAFADIGLTTDITRRMGRYLSGAAHNTVASVTGAGQFRGTASPSGLDALNAAADYYNGGWLVFLDDAVEPTSTPLAGVARRITDYSGSPNYEFTFAGATGDADAPFPQAPSAGASFMIIGHAGTL